MRCVYEIIYKPFENNDKGYPWLYSGSDYHSRPSYFGSPSSKKVFPYTEGLSLRDWWRREVKCNPQNFKKVILADLSDNITRQELLSLESSIQSKEDHAGDTRYFNFTNKNYNIRPSSNPHKGIPLEKIVGKEKAELIKKHRSDSMVETRKTKNWSTKGCVDSDILSEKVKENWSKKTKEERSVIGKKSAETRAKKIADGHTPKKRKQTENKCRWFNNGVESIYILPENCPGGYVKGRGKVKW